MATLNSLYITKEKLETILLTISKKKENGISLTVELKDEMKVFNTKDGKKIEQNVSAWVEQSKEDREAKKPRFYVGNGKTFWSGESKEKQNARKDEIDEIPF